MEEEREIKQRMARFQSYGESLPGAKVYYREDWQVIYFDLLGKIFGIMTPNVTNESKLTIKNRPEINEELREMYPGVIVPGYHTNKKHWNSLFLATGELTDEGIEKLIYQSYELVRQKLTKKEQQLIGRDGQDE